MAEGRLTVAELQERLDTVYAAKTLSELEPVTRDLPGHTELVPRVPSAPTYPNSAPTAPGWRPSDTISRIGGTPTSSVAIAIMSGSDRKGTWVVPTQFTALAVMGGIELDLTEARFAAEQVTITAVAVMGGIDIMVPPDITVIVNGVGLMGAFEDTRARRGAARLSGGPGQRPGPDGRDRGQTPEAPKPQSAAWRSDPRPVSAPESLENTPETLACTNPAAP